MAENSLATTGVKKWDTPEELASSSEEMAVQAEALQVIVEKFKLGEQAVSKIEKMKDNEV